jgi:pimeloyl-ACP methyl ester carboxylesterase
MNMQMEDGKELLVYRDGPMEGEPLVLIHGHGADHRMWQPQLQHYPEAGYQVIAPDMRGHGVASNVDHIEVSDWAEDIRLILDQLAINSAHIIGVSMGGTIAGEFACRYPSRVRSLVLSDSFGKLRQVKEKVLGFFMLMSFRFMRFLSREKLSAYYAKAYEFPGGEKASRYFSEAVKTLAFDQLIATRKAINQVDTEDRLEAIQSKEHKPIHALVMVGTRPGDFFIEMSRRLARSLSTDLVLLDGALDPSNLTATEAFDEHVLSFLGSNSPADKNEQKQESQG